MEGVVKRNSHDRRGGVRGLEAGVGGIEVLARAVVPPPHRFHDDGYRQDDAVLAAHAQRHLLQIDPTAADMPYPHLPKTIDFAVDYLRPGLPRDAYARARVNRSGRRYASVHVEAWQDNRARPFAQATGHFLMPEDEV